MEILIGLAIHSTLYKLPKVPVYIFALLRTSISIRLILNRWIFKFTSTNNIKTESGKALLKTLFNPHIKKMKQKIKKTKKQKEIHGLK